MTELCAGGCGQIGKYYKPTSDNYWCHENHRHCPAYLENMRKKQLENNYNSKRQTMQRQLQRGELKCVHCGETAKYLIHNYAPCCEPTKRDCPKYKEIISKRIKKVYDDNPEYKTMMRRKIASVQKRPEVKERKRDVMLMLHNGDCEKCKEFRKKYLKNMRAGHKRRRTKNYERNLKYKSMTPITKEYGCKKMCEIKKFLGVERNELILLGVYKKFNVEFEDLKEAIEFTLKQMEKTND